MVAGCQSPEYSGGTMGSFWLPRPEFFSPQRQRPERLRRAICSGETSLVSGRCPDVVVVSGCLSAFGRLSLPGGMYKLFGCVIRVMKGLCCRLRCCSASPFLPKNFWQHSHRYRERPPAHCISSNERLTVCVDETCTHYTQERGNPCLPGEM